MPTRFLHDCRRTAAPQPNPRQRPRAGRHAVPRRPDVRRHARCLNLGFSERIGEFETHRRPEREDLTLQLWLEMIAGVVEIGTAPTLARAAIAGDPIMRVEHVCAERIVAASAQRRSRLEAV